jgi:hypothetical protein
VEIGVKNGQTLSVDLPAMSWDFLGGRVNCSEELQQYC